MNARIYAELGRVLLQHDAAWVMDQDEAERIWQTAMDNKDGFEARSYSVSLRTALKITAYEKHRLLHSSPPTIRIAVHRLVAAARDLWHLLRRWRESGETPTP